MCELFAMSSRVPAIVRMSLRELARHGGGSAPHADGWGIACYQGLDVRLIKDASPAVNSPWIPFIREHQLLSPIVLVHLRRATQGGVAYVNTQPFARELGGRMHTFVHNGDLTGIFSDKRFALGGFRTIGQTDSELAFMALLARLGPLWRHDAKSPELEARLAIVDQFASELRTLGPANFLYSDGEVVFAHGHRRRQSDGRIAPPGLWCLHRSCTDEPHDVAGPVEVSAPQEVTLVASVPLTQEAWTPLAEGQLIVVNAGRALKIDTAMAIGVRAALRDFEE